MLRITKVAEDPGSVTLKVEGRVVSDWVQVLEQECLRSLGRNQEVVLDFADVVFVDGRGISMLTRIKSRAVQIVNTSGLLEDLLREAAGR
ncbi:MAG: hypothetical protein HYV62_12475 [Candidatus Rokubacteria bacterium]|nr:hypothetical protein [Candidatus Rokubacteria bacterium]